MSLNQTEARQFTSYHANPDAMSYTDLQLIQDWVEKYPYCQSLHFLAAKTAIGSPAYPKILAQAASISPSRATLYSFIHQLDLFFQKQEDQNKEEIEPINTAHFKASSNEKGELIETITFEPIEIAAEEIEIKNTASNLINVLVPEFNAKQSEEETSKPEEENEQSLSAYHDESLPYTFLWWLNKTRKEHATNLQPYVSFKLDTSKQIRKIESEILNHQIAENIFHLKSLDDLSNVQDNKTIPFNFRKKEYQIIEKFIKEEPQIKPPIASKIDSENKAKRSSEDENLVVSETLAKIYVEQMLYHKALDAYKKLSLKFPEKSAYFASQIKYLELKVN